MKTSITTKSVLFKALFLAIIFVFASCEKESIEPDISSVDASASPASQQGEQTIAAIATAINEETGEFSLLLAALDYTNLTSTFAGDDNYTVFAPTDAAFTTFLDGKELTEFSTDAVANILLYHVTDGRRFSNSVLGKKNFKKIEMLNEAMIYVNSGGGIDTNDENMDIDSNIILPETEDDPKLFDIAATNGVIHVIDAVLVPTE